METPSRELPDEVVPDDPNLIVYSPKSADESTSCESKTVANSESLLRSAVRNPLLGSLANTQEEEKANEISSRDVLCGRGKHSVLQPGNQYLRRICAEVSAAYNSTTRIATKQQIVQKIYSDFGSDGRRFLVELSPTRAELFYNDPVRARRWARAPERKAIEKIRQCIKDVGNSHRRRSLNSTSSITSETSSLNSDRSIVPSLLSQLSHQAGFTDGLLKNISAWRSAASDGQEDAISKDEHTTVSVLTDQSTSTIDTLNSLDDLNYLRDEVNLDFLKDEVVQDRSWFDSKYLMTLPILDCCGEPTGNLFDSDLGQAFKNACGLFVPESPTSPNQSAGDTVVEISDETVVEFGRNPSEDSSGKMVEDHTQDTPPSDAAVKNSPKSRAGTKLDIGLIDELIGVIITVSLAPPSDSGSISDTSSSSSKESSAYKQSLDDFGLEQFDNIVLDPNEYCENDWTVKLIPS